MPCYTIQKNRVDLGKMNQGVLDKALEALFKTRAGQRSFIHDGYRVSIQGDQLISEMPADQLAKLANRIKVSGSKRVLEIAAKKQGMRLKQVPGKKNAYVIGR
jgi:hypothetical protein